MTKQAPSPNGSNGRDDKGRFTKGNPGGPGNPLARQVATLRRALLEAVTTGDVAEIAQGLVKAAKGGDTAAAKLVLGYLIGKPDHTFHPDRADCDEQEAEREEQARKLAELAMSDNPDRLELLRAACDAAGTDELADMLTCGDLAPQLEQLCQAVAEELSGQQPSTGGEENSKAPSPEIRA